MKKIATFDTITKLVKYLKADFTAPFAKKLFAPRKITLSGDLAGEEAFDGSKDVSIKTSVPFLSMLVRQPGKAYKIGDTVYAKDDASIRLACVAGGTTAEGELEEMPREGMKEIPLEEKNFSFMHAHAANGKIVLGDAVGIALETKEDHTAKAWKRIDANGDEMN